MEYIFIICICVLTMIILKFAWSIKIRDIKKLKELGFTEVYGQSSKGNIGSSKVIQNNNGIFINEINGSKYYKILL